MSIRRKIYDDEGVDMKVTLSSGDMVLTIGDVELGTFRLEATRHVALPGAGKRDSLTGAKADLPAGWHGFIWSNNQALALGFEFDTRTGYFKVQATVTIDLGAAVLELSGTVESCEESDSEYADWTSSTVGAKFSTKGIPGFDFTMVGEYTAYCNHPVLKDRAYGRYDNNQSPGGVKYKKIEFQGMKIVTIEVTFDNLEEDNEATFDDDHGVLKGKEHLMMDGEDGTAAAAVLGGGKKTARWAKLGLNSEQFHDAMVAKMKDTHGNRLAHHGWSAMAPLGINHLSEMKMNSGGWVMTIYGEIELGPGAIPSVPGMNPQEEGGAGADEPVFKAKATVLGWIAQPVGDDAEGGYNGEGLMMQFNISVFAQIGISPGGGASLAVLTVTVMVTALPAIGWLKSRVAVFSSTFIFVTTALIGPWGPCSCSCVPGVTPSGSFSMGISANFSSSRSPKPSAPDSLMSFESPTSMPMTPASRPGRTSPPPTMKPSRPLPSDESSSSPVSSAVSLNSTSTIMPVSTFAASAPPLACAATLRRR